MALGGDPAALDAEFTRRLNGPAVIEEMSATTLLLPGQHAIVDDAVNLVVTPLTSSVATRSVKVPSMPMRVTDRATGGCG